MAEVWVKLEAANPTGSYKDRMALAMIEGAERAGRLSPGQPVVEYTGGSTGSSLAFVCAVKGYPLQIVTSDAFAERSCRTMEAFGARRRDRPQPRGITPDLIPRMRARGGSWRPIDAYQTDQFTNTDMVDGYRHLGEEVASRCPGRSTPVPLRRHGRVLPRRQPGAPRQLPGLHPGRRRAGRVGRAVGRIAGHTPHRGRRRRVPARPALRRRHRRGDRRADRRRLRHGPPGDAPRGLFSGPSTGANLVAALAAPAGWGPGIAC